MAGGNYLKIRNDVSFSLVDPNITKIQDNIQMYGQPSQDSSAGLQIRIAATHAGIVTRNNGFYLPAKMKDGAATFTENYNRPVLLHHNRHKDPVGRVIQAGYVDTSGSIKDKYIGHVVNDSKGRHVGTITEQLIKDFVGDKMPFGQQVDVVRSIFKDSLLEDSSYDGLGHIQIIANITDQSAIQKLLDGRYITGSVGATTDRAVCSVCKTDWTKDGQCDHEPGGIYDSRKCFIIAGKLSYDDYSFVNVPADRHSKVLELNYNGIQDSIEVINDYNGRIYEVSLEFPQYDSNDKEDTQMKGKKKVKDSSETTPEVGKTNESTETVVVDSTNTEVESPKGTQETPVEDSTEEMNTSEEVVQDEANVEEVVEDNTTEETIEDFLSQALIADTLSDEDYEKMYDAQWAEVEAVIEDTKIESQKLDTAKRKKLTKSLFCGPNRTLPVTDAAHAIAALQLISKATLEDAVKEKLVKAVNRKAKAKGWNLETKNAKTEDNVETQEDSMNHARMMHVLLAALEENHYSGEDQPLSDDEKGQLAGILKRLASMVGKDAFSDVLITEDLAISAQCETALLNEVETLEDTIGDLRNQVTAVRKEYNALFQDMESLQDALVEEKSTARKIKESHLTTLKTLRDGKVEEEVDWTSLTDEGVASELTRLTDEVDMVKITDKLGDGMSRNPEGNVDDPTEVKDNRNQERLSVANITKIEENYNTLLFKHGVQAAEGYKARMIQEGYLPNPNDKN